MVRFHAGRVRLLVCFLVLPVSLAPLAPAQEAEAKKRLEIMQSALGRLDLESSEPLPKAALALSKEPLLRYSDPTRGGSKESGANVLLDAGVWRLGTQGRPTALVTVELYRAPDASHVLAYEFLALSDAKYSLRHKAEKIGWQPAGSALKLAELPDAPRPAATAAGRLTQMRQMARRFAAREIVNKEPIECRLMSQPIDRYKAEGEKVIDGAIFAFANGTNPEVGVVLEADGARWRYGTLRLTAAEARVTLDGRQVAAYEAFNTRGRIDGPYHNGAHKIKVDFGRLGASAKTIREMVTEK